MSDLSDLVEESVSRLRLLLPLLTSSSTWLVKVAEALALLLAWTCKGCWLFEVALLVAVTVTEVEGVDAVVAVVDVIGVDSSFAVDDDAATGVVVAKRGLKRLPPLTKSDC